MSVELPSGRAICANIKELTDTVLLSFSRGKDSIASYLVLRDIFEIKPYFYYLIPGLEFVEEDLARWEKVFGCRVVRLPAPGLYRMMKNHVYNSPDRLEWIDACDLPTFSHDHLQAIAAEKHGLDPKTAWNALGVRGKDSIARRFEVLRSGGINHKRRIFYPCADLGKSDLVALFRKHSVKLPVDYDLFGCSFDGIYARFLVPLKKHRPRDYQRILEFFPLAEAEVFRAEKAWGVL